MSIAPLSYTRAGSGEPLVLIHGIGHRRQAWDPVFHQLAEKYDVIAIDLAGFGESPAYPKHTPYTMDSAVQHLSENFATWGVDRPHVVGNSLGGAISLELAARGLVRSATALSPAGFFGVKGRAQAMAVLLPIRFVSLLPLPFLKWMTSFAAVRKISGRGLYAHPERFTAEEVFGDARSLHFAKGFERTALNIPKYTFQGDPTVPVTVAWGDHDYVLNPDQADVARARLPRATHISLPNCGHVPMIDDPELIIGVIDRTLARSQSPSPGLRETA